jgi:hypothetical protein
MGNLCRFANVLEGVGKDRINSLKVKGVDTIMSTVNITNGVFDNAGSIIETGSNIKSLGLKWCAKLSMLPLYKEVMAETGADNRMFVRKAERGGFENVHKLFTKLSESKAVPDFVQIDTETYTSLDGITLSFEEQTRMINACINAAKAVNPQCKIILSTLDSTDNEKAKKWYNRFQVSGGKPFDIISLRYELNAENFYDLSMNMSDLSRRFEAKILVDISEQVDPSGADIGLADLDSAIEIVPLEGGFGTVYADKTLDAASLVA